MGWSVFCVPEPTPAHLPSLLSQVTRKSISFPWLPCFVHFAVALTLSFLFSFH